MGIELTFRPQMREESGETTLARNLILARTALRLTQQELATAADVSRATIAQIESGYSDPRLSTIADLAHAVGTSPLLLLLGAAELRAMLEILRGTAVENWLNKLPPRDVARMRAMVSSGMLKHLLCAGQVALESVNPADHPGAALGAAIASTLTPGMGTALGAALGQALQRPAALAKANP